MLVAVVVVTLLILLLASPSVVWLVGDDDVFVVGGIACLQRASKMYSCGCWYIVGYIHMYVCAWI